MENQKRGGKREGAGRKKSERELVKVTVRLYKDQFPISNKNLREAIDKFQQGTE